MSLVNTHSQSVLQVQSVDIAQRQKMLGFLAAGLMVLIWSGYFMSLRIGASSALTTYEIALFRFAIPGLILAPLFVKNIRLIVRVPVVYLLGMLIGGGLPFFWLGAIAMKAGQVAVGSTLIPGVAPLFVTAIAVLIFKQPLSFWRLVGLTLIATGVMTFIVDSIVGDGSLDTVIVFIIASFCWAIFAISLRQCDLNPLVAASVVTLPSAVILLMVGAVIQPALGWHQVPQYELIGQMFTQGIAAGLLSSFLFAFAISKLGAEVTSAIGSLTPVVASGIALMWLAEAMSINVLMGIVLISLGVIFASGIVRKR